MGVNRGFRQRLADMPLQYKLYISLGVLLIGLVLVSALAVGANLFTRNLVDNSLVRQQESSGLAADVNSQLLKIQNDAFEFYTRWERTGFEWETFDQARREYILPIQEQLKQVQANIDEMLRLETDEEILADLRELKTAVTNYENTLTTISDDMEALGYQETGESGMLQATLGRLETRFRQLRLEQFSPTLLEIRLYERAFFQRAQLADFRLTREVLSELRDRINALGDARLAPFYKAELVGLLDKYDQVFFAATEKRRRLQENQSSLINQSDSAGTLAKGLYEKKQVKFDTGVRELESQQTATVVVIVLLVLVVFVGGTLVAYSVSNRIIRSIQTLGEAANRLAAGDLDVRAVVYGQDEIGTTAGAFNVMADRLQELLAGLEQMVAERTRELEAATADLAARGEELEEAHNAQMEINQQLEEAVRRGQHRAMMLQASAEVSRAITQIHDLDRLLPLVTQLISEHFGFYHAGIFLIDEVGRYAVLRAANSPGGQRMLARGHKLAVGAEGIVGYVTRTGQPRISLDVGADAVYFDNPDLPETRSEMALPLRVGGESQGVIGALDVQSTEPAAFDQEDIAVLSTLADQIAIAIQNTELFQQTQEALEEVREAQQRYFRQEWDQFMQDWTALAYEYTLSGVTPSDEAEFPEAEQALTQGQIVTVEAESDEKVPALAAPIRVRDQIIGVLDLQDSDQQRAWSDQEVALVQAVVDQIGPAIESARLFDETQRRALHEAQIRQVTEKIYAQTNIEGILQAVVTELARIIGDAQVYARLGTFDSGEG